MLVLRYKITILYHIGLTHFDIIVAQFIVLPSGIVCSGDKSPNYNLGLNVHSTDKRNC